MGGGEGVGVMGGWGVGGVIGEAPAAVKAAAAYRHAACSP